MPRVRRLLFAVPLALVIVAAAPAARSSALVHRPLVALGANKSSNWFGYNQGELEKGTPFTSVAGDWTVPTARAHVSKQSENSSTWVGIGGGCLDTSCSATDNTLIQAGTEQDVSSAGAASYYAWWELLPQPSTRISGLTVRAGDHIHVAIGLVSSGMWNITLVDTTRHETFNQTMAYSSSEATAEWIEETPTLVGTGGATTANLPKLSTVHFDLARANGNPAGLVTAEEIELVNSSGKVIGVPSSPDGDRDGFNDCSWTSSCTAP